MAAPVKVRVAFLVSSRFQSLVLKQFSRCLQTRVPKTRQVSVSQSTEESEDGQKPESGNWPSSVQMVDWVADSLANGSFKHKHHPGHLTLPSITLPQRLLDAAAAILEKYPVQELSHKADKLANYLWSRHTPPTDEQITKIANEVHQQLVEKKASKGKDGPVEKDHLLRTVRQKIYHWQPVTYDAYKCLLYLTSHLALNYTILLQCFTEMSKRDPEFKPRSVYNFGSGVGSAVWAANSVWGSQVYEYYCVDKSQDMNTVARLLLQDGDSQKQMSVPGVIFRQFPPSAKTNQFELVVSAYTLLDHPGPKRQRLEMIEGLWKMTSHYLVLVENGTSAGFSLIHEARDHLLQVSSSSDDESVKGHVFAPCPHDGACPKAEKQQFCFSQANYKPLPQNHTKSNKCSSRYSYVVMRKGERQDTEEPWPRVIQHTVNASKHTHCHLCCNDGKARHMIFTSKRHGADIYKCSRYTAWGDRFPVKFTPEQEDEQQEDEKQEDERAS